MRSDRPRCGRPSPTGAASLRRRFVLVALVAVLTSGKGAAEEVERVLASVDRRPILLSEVRALEAVRGLARPVAIDALIDESLMFREAARLQSAASAALQEEEALREILTSHPDLLDRAAEADVRRLVRRQAVILRYVELRFLPQVRISDEVVREAYDREHAGRPEAPPFEAAAESVRARLARQDLDARIEGWVKELRAGAEIRYNR
jgi:hypothetical protein